MKLCQRSLRNKLWPCIFLRTSILLHFVNYINKIYIVRCQQLLTKSIKNDACQFSNPPVFYRSCAAGSVALYTSDPSFLCCWEYGSLDQWSIVPVLLGVWLPLPVIHRSCAAGSVAPSSSSPSFLCCWECGALCLFCLSLSHCNNISLFEKVLLSAWEEERVVSLLLSEFHKYSCFMNLRLAEQEHQCWKQRCVMIRKVI